MPRGHFPRTGLRTLVCALTCALAGALPETARSDQPAADKSRYTLANPTPDAELRSFSPDRPAKGTGPYTVDAGHVQYEIEAFNFSRQKTASERTCTWVGPSPTVKLGISNWLDLEANLASIIDIETRDLSTGDGLHQRGAGDLYLRAKINVWGNDGGKTAFALVPFVKAPTAGRGIGNGATEGGIILPLAISLPNDLSLSLNTEFDILKDETSGGYHAGYVNIIGLSAPLAKGLTLTTELWSSIVDDPSGVVRQFSFDVALAWMASSNLQWDVGANFGLNSETPRLQIYGGIAQRY